jgi:hypothetical protein
MALNKELERKTQGNPQKNVEPTGYEQRKRFLNENKIIIKKQTYSLKQPETQEKQYKILTDQNSSSEPSPNPHTTQTRQDIILKATTTAANRAALSDWMIKYNNCKEVAFVFLQNLQTAFETSLLNGVIISAQSLTLSHEDSLAIQFFSLIKCYDKTDPNNYKYLFNSDDIITFFTNYPHLEYAIIGDNHADKTTSIKKFISNCLTSTFAQTYTENNVQKTAYSFNLNHQDPITNIAKDADFSGIVITKTINHPDATGTTQGTDYLLTDCQQNKFMPYISGDSCLIFDKDHPLHSLFFHYVATDSSSNLSWTEPTNFHISFTTLH